MHPCAKTKSYKTVNYRGITTSIKICKGVRYRLGSISPTRETNEFWEDEDYGKFFITNQRIGFLGITKILQFLYLRYYLYLMVKAD